MQVSAPSRLASSINQSTNSSQSLKCAALFDFKPKCISVKHATFLNKGIVIVLLFKSVAG
jgi:hypothetical protein